MSNLKLGGRSPLLTPALAALAALALVALVLLPLVLRSGVAAESITRSYEEGETIAEEEHSCCDHSMQITESVARLGSRALEVTLRPEDPKWYAGGYRSEYHGQDRYDEGETAWFAFSIYLPADFDLGDNPNTWNDRIIFQFADEGSPHLSLHLDADRGEFFVRRKSEDGKFHYLARFPAQVGVWHDLQMHVRFTQQSDGYVEMWQGDQQVLNYSGRTLAVRTSTYSKWGIYGQPTHLYYDAVIRSSEGPIVLSEDSSRESTNTDAAPSVALTKPAEGAEVAGNVLVGADATDDHGIAQVEFLVDGARIAVDTDGSDGWSTPWDTTSVADGARTLTARATDSSGQTASDSVSVTVSNAQPATATMSVASVTYEAYGGRDGKRHVDLRVQVVDGAGAPLANAVVEVEIAVDGTHYLAAIASTDASGTAVFPMRNTPSGSYTETGTVRHEQHEWDGAWPASQPSDPFVK